MPASTTDRNTPHRDALLIAVAVAAGAVIHGGTMVCADATGFATPGATADDLTYIGMADEAVDNTDGADGDTTVLVRRGRAFKWANHGADPVTQASLMKDCYIVDNQTVAATDGGATRSKAGKVLAVDADGVWVL